MLLLLKQYSVGCVCLIMSRHSQRLTYMTIGLNVTSWHAVPSLPVAYVVVNYILAQTRYRHLFDVFGHAQSRTVV